LAQRKSPKASVLEAATFRRRHGNIYFAERVIFPKIRAYQTLRIQILHCCEFKEPNPAPPDNGAIKEKPRPHGHTSAGHGKKPGLLPLADDFVLKNPN
jgi:hypothetical protein